MLEREERRRRRRRRREEYLSIHLKPEIPVLTRSLQDWEVCG
jgi:hypothetical protein